jgi:hypothetical protein
MARWRHARPLKPELIVLAARIVAQQRKGVPPGSSHYLQEPLNQEHQEPVVNATPQGRRANSPSSQLSAAAPTERAMSLERIGSLVGMAGTELTKSSKPTT